MIARGEKKSAFRAAESVEDELDDALGAQHVFDVVRGLMKIEKRYGHGSIVIENTGMADNSIGGGTNDGAVGLSMVIPQVVGSSFRGHEIGRIIENGSRASESLDG